ncbi:hypothetical protein ACO22_01350 [Paracoccidioides brasiliensis]|uniref:Uncharacterized protein n=1 Tax=Paracoccidioides brasiliensis TaxID=121759 RepID=A0A1D2JM88_PARBR|nr:hypothetical protein ACO22_01350 [Paracoccidioides brasiliensis]ODH52318.1 hypothetical protein GX48_01381 [Paracoccidioides brasiliensis]
MEPSICLLGRQESPGTRWHHPCFRARVGSFFTGTSSIGAQNVPPFSKPPAPRIGLRLFSGERADNSRPRQHGNASRIRRPSTSISPFIDRHTPSSAMDVQPSALSRMDIDETGQTQGPLLQDVNGSNNNSLPSAREAGRAYAGTWIGHRNCDKSKSNRFCCGPGVKCKEARRKLIDCVLAGFLLIAVFIIYIVLSFSFSVLGREFHVVLILVLMLLVIYFSHSFIRFLMIAWRQAPPYVLHMGERVGTSGYAQPDRPIPVILARDEEDVMGMDVHANNATGSNNSNGPTLPPPAYGLWKSSVKINPNLVHWQRREEADVQRSTEVNSANDVPNRPPSYVSDDGVQYVLDLPSQRQRETESSESHPRPLAREDSDIHPAERSIWKP